MRKWERKTKTTANFKAKWRAFIFFLDKNWVQNWLMLYLLIDDRNVLLLCAKIEKCIERTVYIELIV